MLLFVNHNIMESYLHIISMMMFGMMCLIGGIMLLIFAHDSATSYDCRYMGPNNDSILNGYIYECIIDGLTINITINEHHTPTSYYKIWQSCDKKSYKLSDPKCGELMIELGVAMLLFFFIACIICPCMNHDCCCPTKRAKRPEHRTNVPNQYQNTTAPPPYTPKINYTTVSVTSL